jgi:hypothetical protein
LSYTKCADESIGIKFEIAPPGKPDGFILPGLIDLGNQAVRVAGQQSLPRAVGYEVELLENDRPDQGIGASRFDDRGEDTGSALDLQSIGRCQLGRHLILPPPRRPIGLVQ